MNREILSASVGPEVQTRALVREVPGFAARCCPTLGIYVASLPPARRRQSARAGQGDVGKSGGSEGARFATIVRSPTKIDDDSPVKWMALGAYAELLLSAQEGRRARSATAHAEDLLMAICEAVPGSSRREPSVAFNNGILRAKRCGAGAESQTWKHVICVQKARH